MLPTQRMQLYLTDEIPATSRHATDKFPVTSAIFQVVPAKSQRLSLHHEVPDDFQNLPVKQFR